MTQWWAPFALLPEGWARDVTIDVDAAGRIKAVMANSAPCGMRLDGAVVPAMPNLHSHAFQRAIAGRTGQAAPGRDDSFWTWRQAMYAFLDRVDGDAFEAIAAQAYVEMVKAGYGAVAEFHYVHHDPAGRPYADAAELAWRVVAAARTARIALTLLPVFYAHAGFGGTATTAGQRRFAHTTTTFSRLVDRLRSGVGEHGYVLGIAPHSLRAVTPEELALVVALVAPEAPVHIHAAEQSREVDECFAWSGMRPVEWLLAKANIDARWCVVHATHMTERETADLAASHAVAGLALTTEADLGDGTFPGHAYLGAGGRYGIGSDSNTMISPFAELRQFEWSQRLRARKRNVLAQPGPGTIGTTLWSSAATSGAQAVGRASGSIAAGRRADLVVLNLTDPALAEQQSRDLLDAAIFGPAVMPVRDVLIAGEKVVEDGRHRDEDAVFARYRAAMARLNASS